MKGDTFMNYYRYPLTGPIQTIVAAYHQQFKQAPAQMVVHPKHQAAARQALTQLDLPVELSLSGGCLVSEIWLNIPGPVQAPALIPAPAPDPAQLSLF